jgi:hypothetical protein
MNSMFTSLCEFYVVLDYDEMNCNLVFGVLNMYSKMYRMVLKCLKWLFHGDLKFIATIGPRGKSSSHWKTNKN